MKLGNHTRQYLCEFILAKLRIERKEGCMCLFAFLPPFAWIVSISSGLWYCFQIIWSKFVKKIIWGNFSFLFFLSPKYLDMVQMILPSVSAPSAMTSNPFLRVIFPLNTNYCLGCKSSLFLCLSWWLCCEGFSLGQGVKWVLFCFLSNLLS